jgi:hypothetical protein
MLLNNFIWPDMIPNFELKIKTNFFHFFEKSSLQQKMSLKKLQNSYLAPKITLETVSK